MSTVTPDEDFTYDPMGNRLTASDTTGDWAYNDNNELESNSNTSYVYDANANMTRKTVSGVVTLFFYNIEDRLERVQEESGNIITAYGYDPFGRRLYKEVSGIRTYYLYSDEGLIGEYTSSGNEIKAYGWKPGSTWGTAPLFMKVGSEYYFYHNDHLGTPQKMTAVNGAVVWSTKFSSFGKAEVDPGATIVNNLRLPGQYFDSETGLHYNWHRYYDPDTGRYLTPDPIGLAGGINPFVYVLNDPINMIDPLGLFSLNDAINSLRENKVKGENGIYMYSPTQVFDEWLRLESNDTKWLDELPVCPKKINPCENPYDNTWNNPCDANPEHKGATYEMRSRPTSGGHASQCSYDSNGNLMTGIPAGGTADRGAWARGTMWRHYTDDYKPWKLAEQLNRRQDYYYVRPTR